jgi:hypothetical protein
MEIDMPDPMAAQRNVMKIMKGNQARKISHNPLQDNQIFFDCFKKLNGIQQAMLKEIQEKSTFSQHMDGKTLVVRMLPYQFRINEELDQASWRDIFAAKEFENLETLYIEGEMRNIATMIQPLSALKNLHVISNGSFNKAEARASLNNVESLSCIVVKGCAVDQKKVNNISVLKKRQKAEVGTLRSAKGQYEVSRGEVAQTDLSEKPSVKKSLLKKK